jgi:site-specific DNA recombinase
MLEVNRAIAQAAEQSHNISKLQAAGLLDTDACAAKLNAINIQLTQLRRERRRLLEHDDIEDTIGRLHQTADAIKAGPERLDTFDEDLFEELVEEIVAESQTRIRFRLHGGIELAEKVGRAKR